MKKLFTLLFLFSFIGASAQVRISQVYGGGGNSGATYNQDFVELFNAGSTAADISNYSIQYASTSGTSWAVTAIPASTSIPAGGYFLIGLGGGSTGVPLPATDLTGSSNMGATNGKVALVNSTTALSGSSACGDASVVDAVGFGTASCFEGTAASSTGIGNANSFQRKGNGCTETNNNLNDFELLPVSPRNSASPLNVCGAAGPLVVANPSTVSGMTTLQGVASSSQQIDISGTNLTGAPGNITATASSTNIQVSNDNSTWGISTSVNYTAATLTATPIYVRISSTAPLGAVAETISINGGGITTAIEVTVDGNVTTAAPTVQATNILISNINDNGFDVNWTNGNGSERILVVRPSSSTQVLPTDGSVYSLSDNLGSGNIVHYVGNGTGPVSVSGLSTGTDYTVYVYEYNGVAGNSNYNTSTATNNPVNTTTTGITNTLQQGYFHAESAPLFMASGSPNRMPTMYIATVSSLTPNTTYRYYTQAAEASDFGNTATGAGASILTDYTVTPATFSISSSGGLTTVGSYGKFTTDATGKFTGTFGFTQTGNARFTAGSEVYPSIAVREDALGDGAPQYRFALDEAITPLAFSTSAGPTNGTFLQGSSLGTAGNLVAVWQSTDGSSFASARPLSMTLIETITPTSGTWTTNFITGYSTTAGSWNTVIPNDLPNGVRLIQQINLMGEVIGCESDADGIWPDGGNTINPTGGTTPIIITDTDAPIDGGVNCEAVLPVSLSNFAVQKLGNTAKLIWSTEQEFNSHAFIIERSFNQTTWVPIGTVAAAGISQTLRQYSFNDNSPVRGTNFYRLRMVDQDLKSQLSETKSLQFNITKSVLISPNPANNYVNVYISETGKSEIVISNMSGKIVDRLQTQDQHIQINTSKYAAGIYIVKIMNGGETTTQKLVVQ